MPQPYLPTFASKRYSIGFKAIDKLPAFAAAIGNFIAQWSYVDNEIGGLFGILLGTESQAAYRIFLVLRRWSNQRQALDAAAAVKLTGDEHTLFRVLMTEYGGLEAKRNELAHSCFGNCPDDDSLLFAINVDHHVIWQADVIPRLSRGDAADPHKGLKEALYVYKLPELERMHADARRLWQDMFYFNGYLREMDNPRRKQEFEQLLNSPRIQKRIAVLP